MAGKARKTVDVQALKDAANKQLSRTDVTTEFRKGIASMLEFALWDANAYRGYNDIYWLKEGGCEAWKASGLEDTLENMPQKRQYFYRAGDGVDDYRRMYY